MKEQLKILSNLCEAHDIEMPDNVLDLKYYEFGVDKEEARHLLQDIAEEYAERCYLEN